MLFGNPERALGAISPDGRWLAYLAPRDGVMNVWVAPVADPDAARPVTDDRRGVREFAFAYLADTILFPQDADGDENFQWFAVDVVSGASRALSPAGSRASLSGRSPSRPSEIVLQLNDRDPQYFDPVRVNLVSGASERLLENDRFLDFVVDGQLEPRIGVVPAPDGSQTWFVRGADGWSPWLEVPFADTMTTAVAALTEDGATVYLVDSRGRDTAGLFAVELATGAVTLLHQDPRADVCAILTHPVTGRVQAVLVRHLFGEWTALDPALRDDVAVLSQLGAEVDVRSRTLDDRRWVLIVSEPTAGNVFSTYERPAGTVRRWFATRPALAELSLAPMRGVEIPTRDGLSMPSYLTRPLHPATGGAEAAPMVLLVHGGPWARDTSHPNPWHWWLADRGYTVLSVNFRGSSGFGKAFLNAGDRQWARAMHDDLLDAVAWAVAEGVADPARIAIMGGSYGGYAALVGLAFTPDVFACGVDIVGPSSLITLLGSIPPYWEPMKRQMILRVGDDTTDEGRAFLRDRSPLHRVEAIVKPLLIAQGANDPRVKQAEADQIVAAMTHRGIPVTYTLFPDEGHGFSRPENSLAFVAVTDAFLAGVLGGRAEPIGDDLRPSTITVPAGAGLIDGLAAALPDSSLATG
ncbi:MAG: S9 family peptidase [Myxococcota bacterium]